MKRFEFPQTFVGGDPVPNPVKRTSVTLTEPVTVKVIVTSGFREQYLNEIEKQLEALDAQKSALDASTAGAQGVQKQQLTMELQRLRQTQQALDLKAQQLEQLQDGVEIPYQQVQSLVEVKLGDNFLQKWGTEIVLKDWEVVEIRSVMPPLA